MPQVLSTRRRRLHPADVITLGILVVVTATLAAAVLRGVDLGSALLLHGAVLAGYAALTAVLVRTGGSTAAALRAIGVIAVMFTLYTTLGHIAFAAIPWLADPWLDAADRLLLLGRAPVLAVASLISPRGAEVLSAFYAAFIPYLYLTILLGLLGRPAAERDELVTGFALLYSLSFLGYLFLPARGPIVFLAGEFAEPLRGGPIHALVVRSIDQVGGPHGAFPSLHLGASLFAAYFDARHGNLLRALIYVPLVALIAVATVALRYHYVVDLLAGAALAILASHAAPRLLARWREQGQG